MPDNTWFTPYVLPNKDCLSIAPSDGLVYKLSEDHVLKMPYQYPVKEVGPSDMIEAVDKLQSSQSSLDSFNSERAFYRLLELACQQDIEYDIVRVDHPTFQNGILLEYLQPLEIAWKISSSELRLRWIQQLLRATAKIETLGYTHCDLAIRNMGVDKNNDLKLFDFGSVHHRGDKLFIEKDLSRLASCVHFLLSGNDPLASPSDWESLRQVKKALLNGTFAVDTLARPVEDILKICWSKNLEALPDVDLSMIFRHIGKAIRRALDIKDEPNPSEATISERLPESSDEAPKTRRLDRTHVAFDASRYELTHDSRWMTEDKYREAWESVGVGL